MKIKVDDDVFDVTVQVDGSWKLFWEDGCGKNYHIYRKDQVHKFLIEEEVWEIIPEPKEEFIPSYSLVKLEEELKTVYKRISTSEEEKDNLEKRVKDEKSYLKEKYENAKDLEQTIAKLKGETK